MGRWAWSSDAWDFDHDGFPDLYVANGMVSGPSRDDLNSCWRQVVANSPVEYKPAQDYEQGWKKINELIRSDGTWSRIRTHCLLRQQSGWNVLRCFRRGGPGFCREENRAFALAG